MRDCNYLSAMAAAAEGHPCLRELTLDIEGEAWLHAIPRLPALSALELYLDGSFFRS